VELLLLGTGNAFAPRGRAWSGALLDGRVLLDCPPQAVPALRAAGAELPSIDAALLSHAHLDHVAGLPFLLLVHRYREPRGEGRPLEVACSAGTWRAMLSLLELGYPGTFTRAFMRAAVRAVHGRAGEAGGIPFLRLPVRHAGPVPCSGFRLDLGGATLAYSGDAGPGPLLDRIVAGARWALVEVSEPRPTEGHLCPTDVRALAKGHPGTRFLCIHVYGDGVEGELAGLANVRVCRDGERVGL
jgi:ribonuclease BN (tRNA processing enzyme)